MSDPAATVIIMDYEQVTGILASIRLDPYCSLTPRLLGVVDANAILSSVDNDCRKGPHWRSRLLRMTSSGTAVLYAPDHIYTEVYRRMPKIARSSPVPLDALRERFEAEYLPALRYVTVDITAIADPQVLAITDPDDVPTGQLAKLIAPCVVFSEDKHLRKPGLAPPAWREAAKFGVDLVEGVTGQRITGNLATLPFRGGAELIAFLGRKTGISPWIIGGIVAAGATYVLTSPQRRQAVGRYVMPVAEALVKEMERSAALEQHAIASLREILLAALPEPNVKQQAAIVLARHDEPLLAREVQQCLLRFFPDDRVPTVAGIRAALRDGPEFVQPERYRWQFGREAGPWRGCYREPAQ
jgi:predicted nucleic acid-binding protein